MIAMLKRCAGVVSLAACLFMAAPAEAQTAAAASTPAAVASVASQETGPSTPSTARAAHAGATPHATSTTRTPISTGLDLQLPAAAGAQGQTALALRIVIGLTLLAVLPSLLICMTSFLRIIIVLSMLRQAIGMPETPPNPVLIGLGLFLTLFTMQPVFQKINHDAVTPYLQGSIDTPAAYQATIVPLRDFMVRQTREHDLALMVDLSKAPRPNSVDDISLVQLVPAFILSELRAAFQIGFVIFLPFLLIDLIVSSILMALGMMMMPPVTIALPMKILMFVLVDGWSLVLKALVESFH